MSKATIQVKGLKLTVVLKPEALPRDAVPMDGPVGDIDLELVLEGGAVRLAARLNGKNYRKVLRTIDANSGNVAIVLQGNVRPTPEGAPLVLDSAGFQVNVKTPKQCEGEAVAPSARPPTEIAPPVATEAPDSPKQPEPPRAPTPPQAVAPLPGMALPGRRVYVPQQTQVFRRRG
ncbi:MAG: hypothetical protein HY901_12005 [Deltaproteobacteria bacterium]|nr:hypothetical protein [Deltaproteobacteria bacterium]